MRKLGLKEISYLIQWHTAMWQNQKSCSDISKPNCLPNLPSILGAWPDILFSKTERHILVSVKNAIYFNLSVTTF